MQRVVRSILPSLLAADLTGSLWAMEGTPQAPTPSPSSPHPAAEYKRSDANFYPKAAFVKDHPTAVIIPRGGYTQTGDSYFFTPKIRAPKEIYFEVVSDWIEPITPPDMPASLGVAPDAMQVREPQGDVQVALPSAPASFAPVTDGMPLPNGAVIKTGANGTAAVLFGGVDSARLMPNSEAAVQQTVSAQSRSAEVDLTTGGVFSKVGSQIGVKGEYSVHTPFGNAVAHGGDFATITASNRTDVWIAQGTVNLEPANSKAAETATSDGTGTLKLLRFPPIAAPHLALLADVETLSAALNFIPLADQKIKALRDKKAGGATLTANEEAYLSRIKQVPCLIKLALVEPPAPAPAPIAVAPAPIAPVVKVPATPVPAKPLTVTVHADGTIKFQHATMNLADFQTQLDSLAQATPHQALVIKAGKTVAYEKVKDVLDACAKAQLKIVSVVAPPPAAPTPAQPTPAPSPAPASHTVPVAAATPAALPAPHLSAGASLPRMSLPTAAKPAGPVRFTVRMDGKINFKGVTLTLPEFKSKLQAIVQATPDQAIFVKAGKTVPYENFQAALAICHSVPVTNLAFSGPSPSSEFDAPVAPQPGASNLPAPNLLMHPSMTPTPSTTQPTAPTPSATTNTPPPTGP